MSENKLKLINISYENNGEEYSKTSTNLVKGENDRGFGHLTFLDRYHQVCSLQDSSLATEPAIWLGVDNVGRDEDDEITSNWQLVDYFKSKIKKVSFSEQSSSSDLEVTKIKVLEAQVKSLTEKNSSLSKRLSQLEKVQDMINQIKNLK